MARLLEQVLNQVLQAQAQDALQAALYERTPDRQGYRNGTYDRPLTTRVGSLTLRVPRLRDGSFSPDLFARYQRQEQAFVLALLEMVINGVSTRKVTRITEELCGTEISKSAMSALCHQLDPIVTAWRTRSLTHTPYPFLLVDALVLRVREGGYVRPRAGGVVRGVNAAGQREILGCWAGDSESEGRECLKASPAAHGLSGPQSPRAPRGGPRGGGPARRLGVGPPARVAGDDVAALPNPLCRYRHKTHKARNVLDKVPDAARAELKAHLAPIREAATRADGQQAVQRFRDTFGARYPSALKSLEDD